MLAGSRFQHEQPRVPLQLHKPQQTIVGHKKSF